MEVIHPLHPHTHSPKLTSDFLYGYLLDLENLFLGETGATRTEQNDMSFFHPANMSEQIFFCSH